MCMLIFMLILKMVSKSLKKKTWNEKFIKNPLVKYYSNFILKSIDKGHFKYRKKFFIYNSSANISTACVHNIIKVGILKILRFHKLPFLMDTPLWE